MANRTGTRGFVIAATASGVGKTTVTAAICRALHDMGHVVQPFKTGPDFVDPTYLTMASGRACRNLDGFPNPGLMPYFYAAGCAPSGSLPAADIAVVEGVMGMYDGLGADGLYSTAWLAGALGLPVVLLVDARAAATSVAATAHGFASLAPLAPRVAGVIANRVSGAAHADLIGEALLRYAGIPLVGWLPKVEDVAFPSRHLGLIPAQERRDTEERLERMTAVLRKSVDLERLVSLAEPPAGDVAPPTLPPPVKRGDGGPVRVAIAADDAFCFRYYDNEELLAALGAEIVRTSPLADGALPDDIDLLILPGGYPEEFAGHLSGNGSYLQSVRAFSRRGAIYAECGGMLYLAREMTCEGGRHGMAGLIDADAVMTDRLQRFGYVEATALSDNLLFRKGETVRAHEFHYSKLSEVPGKEPGAFSVRRVSRRGEAWRDGYAANDGRLLATYLHIHFYSCPEAVARMLASCR